MRNMILVLVLACLMATVAVASESGSGTFSTREPAEYLSDPNDMTQVPRLVRKTLFRATTKAKRGEHADAAALLEEFLAENPDQDHHLVRYHLARSYDAMERYGAARDQYAVSVEMEPRLYNGWFGLGHVSYALGDYGASGDAFLKSFRTALDPAPETLYFAAAGYMLAEDHDAAAPLLEELCSGVWGDQIHDWYAQLAACAIKMERADLAAAPLERYLAGDPGQDEAWYLVYQFHVGFGNYRDAAVALTMVGYLRDLTPTEQRTLGDLYAALDVPALAGDRYRTVLAENASAGDYERLVSALVEAHDLDAALAALEQGVAAFPTARLWSLLGDVNYMKRDYAAAADAFARVIEMDPEQGRAWLMTGYCYIELGNRGQAIRHLVNAAKHGDQADLAERLLLRARKMDQA